MNDPSPSTPAVRVDRLSKVFGENPERADALLETDATKEEIMERTGQVVALRDITFSVNDGEVFVLMGLSGSGKSTLLRCINRLFEPTRGSVLINTTDIGRLTPRDLRAFQRKTFGMVFQHFTLFPHRTVLENAAFGLEIQGVPAEERLARGRDVLRSVGLEQWGDKQTGELSGGMQQRVGLARALAVNPEILLMDEPFSALDPLIRSNLQNELLRLHDTVGKTIIFVTHDLNEAVRVGDRIAIINSEGRMVQIGTPEEILLDPADAYVETFLNDIDRPSVVRVSSVMRAPRHTVHDTTPPAKALEEMNRANTEYAFVITTEQGFRGVITRDRVARAATTTGATLSDITRAADITHTDRTIKEILPHVLESDRPVAVLDAEEYFVGEISRREIATILKKQLSKN